MKYILTCLLSLLSLLLAQTTLKAIVINSKGEPLPLTSIVLIKSNADTITNDEGQFNLVVSLSTDSIKISNIAYYPTLVAVADLRNSDTITLSENIQQLNEIVLRNFSNYKTNTTIGFYDYSNKDSFALGPGNQLATYIPNKKGQEGWIKGVSFKLKQLGKCKNSLRIRILQMDSMKFMPAMDILDENVIIKPDD